MSQVDRYESPGGGRCTGPPMPARFGCWRCVGADDGLLSRTHDAHLPVVAEDGLTGGFRGSEPAGVAHTAQLVPGTYTDSAEGSACSPGRVNVETRMGNETVSLLKR